VFGYYLTMFNAYLLEITSCLRRIDSIKDLCHQDTKTRSFLIIVISLCLGAFVANLSGSSGLGFKHFAIHYVLKIKQIKLLVPDQGR
jgi:hypothetical protein